MRIETAVDSSTKQRGAAVRKGLDSIGEGERQADQLDAGMLTKARLVGSKALEAYHRRKGPMEGSREQRPSPTLAAILADPEASRIEVETARQEGAARSIAAATGMER